MKKRFYYFGDEKIQLTSSKSQIAIRFAQKTSRTSYEEIINNAKEITSSKEAQILFDMNLAVVNINKPTGKEEVSSIKKKLVDKQGIQSVWEVYNSNQKKDEYMILTDQISVQFKKSQTKLDIDKINHTNKVEIIERDFLQKNHYLLKVNHKVDEDALDIANRYHQMDEVEYAEPEFVISLQPNSPSANDPRYSQQWALQQMNIPSAWNLTKGSPQITIAILDDGVDMNHPDLREKIVSPYDALTDTNNAQPNRWDAHGTACAGIAAASTNNDQGIAGVAANSRIMPVRIGQMVNEGDPRWTTSNIIIARGIREAVDRGADVLSNSYSSENPHNTIQSAMTYATESGRDGLGCIVICAAGNYDENNIRFPAGYDNCFACGASDQLDFRVTTARHGWGSNYGSHLDFTAPGVDIVTTDNVGSGGYSSLSNYTTSFGGTSAATPYAAGVAALILSIDRNLKYWEVGDIMKLSAHDIAPDGRDDENGWGRIDAYPAVKAAKKVWLSLKSYPVFLGEGEECYIRFSKIIFETCGIERVRLDSFKVESFDHHGNVKDVFEYHGNPGGIMGARLTRNGVQVHHQQFENILLEANGTAKNWRYGWKMSWNYTYWPNSSSLTDNFVLQPLYPLIWEHRYPTSGGVKMEDSTSGFRVAPLSADIDTLVPPYEAPNDRRELIENRFNGES